MKKASNKLIQYNRTNNKKIKAKNIKQKNGTNIKLWTKAKKIHKIMIRKSGKKLIRKKTSIRLII